MAITPKTHARMQCILATELKNTRIHIHKYTHIYIYIYSIHMYDVLLQNTHCVFVYLRIQYMATAIMCKSSTYAALTAADRAFCEELLEASKDIGIKTKLQLPKPSFS